MSGDDNPYSALPSTSVVEPPVDQLGTRGQRLAARVADGLLASFGAIPGVILLDVLVPGGRDRPSGDPTGPELLGYAVGGIGYLSVCAYNGYLFGDARLCLHDRIAGTRVLRA